MKIIVGHLFPNYLLLDCLRPWTRTLVCQEGHRSGPVRPVAYLTILLQYRKHVLIKGDRRNGDLSSQCHNRAQETDNDESIHKQLPIVRVENILRFRPDTGRKDSSAEDHVSSPWKGSMTLRCFLTPPVNRNRQNCDDKQGRSQAVIPPALNL